MSFTVENPNENSFGGGFDDNYAYLFGNSQAPPLPNWGNFESLKSIKSVNKGADDNGEKSGNQPSFQRQRVRHSMFESIKKRNN